VNLLQTPPTTLKAAAQVLTPAALHQYQTRVNTKVFVPYKVPKNSTTPLLQG
jgi:hypothetical protein